MKQYEVEVLGRHAHGRYGKEKYTCWCLGHTSKAGAEDFALDILSGKTWKELMEEIELLERKRALETIRFTVWKNDWNEEDTIGLENAERFFSFKATRI